MSATPKRKPPTSSAIRQLVFDAMIDLREGRTTVDQCTALAQGAREVTRSAQVQAKILKQADAKVPAELLAFISDEVQSA